MTVATDTNRKTFAGDAVSTSFATSPLVFFTSSDLIVTVTVDATGASTTLTENTHYSVSGGGTPAAVGTVSLAGGSSPYGAPAAGVTVTVLRDVAVTQEADFVQNDGSDAEVSEAAHDRLTMIAQRLGDRLDRTLHLPDGDVAGLTTEIPGSVTRAAKVLGFDALGSVTVYDASSAVTAAANVTGTAATAGAVSESVESHNNWEVWLTDFLSNADRALVRAGTTVNVDTALAAFFALLTAGTGAQRNVRLRVPAGKYAISTTASPANSASNFIIEGDGQDSTTFIWTGTAGIPMFKFTNPRAIWMRDLSLYGSSSKPSAMVQYHRAAGGTIGPAVGYCGLQRVRIGDGTGDHTKGVLTSGTVDSNNEQHIFEDVQVIGSQSYGYHFSHSNSLLHHIVRGNIASYVTAAISNDCSGANNASFKVWGTTFSGAAGSVMFEVGNPRNIIEIHGAYHENGAANTKILSEIAGAPFVSGGIRFFGGHFAMGDPSSTSTVVWNGDSASFFEAHACSILTASGATYNFKGAGRVKFRDGSGTTASMTYNGETILDNFREAAGAPTYTQAGSGTLRMPRSAGTSQIAVADIATSATPSVSGLKVEGMLVLQPVGATNVTQFLNGVAGQVFTAFANNGNATIVHGTTADKPFLKGAANVTLATSQLIRFQKLGTVTGNDVWLEISRNF